RPGVAFAPDTAWQQELESSFPYEETPDQVAALAEIKADMESDRPMDRLLCGDVGFGKTELALRAAFKAAMSGKQVAVLAPTTVLAQQHFHVFRERLKNFPVVVEMLSRFVDDETQERTVEGLKSGHVDIVVGTHRLLQRDVRFKRLSLLVVDEEHRFGVMQKERLKKLRTQLDVLSLSATPIPRTLHMAVGGIRDMSVIQTPPEERQPIKTYVTADDDELVREAIGRELQRGGQVYFVHNRVRTPTASTTPGGHSRSKPTRGWTSSPASMSSARDSRSPFATWRSAAPATCWARSSTGRSRPSGSRCISRCCRARCPCCGRDPRKPPSRTSCRRRR